MEMLLLVDYQAEYLPFYKKLRRKVSVGGVSMFVVAGCLSRSGRAGYRMLKIN
jgi:hypothetical protein